MPSLRVIVEGREVHWRQLTSAVVIGRGEECDLRLPDRKMSRIHCVVRPRGGAWIIEDLGSHNGTMLRGYPVAAEELRDRDAVKAGDVTLEFYQDDAPAGSSSNMLAAAAASSVGAPAGSGAVVTWSAIAQSNAMSPAYRRRNRSLWELANRGAASGNPPRHRSRRAAAKVLRAKRKWAKQNDHAGRPSALQAIDFSLLVHQRVSWPLGITIAVLITAALWYWRDYDGGPSRNDHRPLIHHHHSANAD